MDAEHGYFTVVLSDLEASDFDRAVDVRGQLIDGVSGERDIVLVVPDEGCRRVGGNKGLLDCASDDAVTFEAWFEREVLEGYGVVRRGDCVWSEEYHKLGCDIASAFKKDVDVSVGKPQDAEDRNWLGRAASVEALWGGEWPARIAWLSRRLRRNS